MRATFMGLELGKRSIMAQQTSLDVTGHNIANANTVGYTRQEANLVTTRPYHTPMLTGSTKVGQLGTGAEVADIRRLRDAFVDNQIRNENKTSGYWTAMQDSLSKIEVILNEPTETGLRGVMDMFWMSWQDLSAHPESEAVRSVVAQRGTALADAVNHSFRQLKELKEDVNAAVKVKVEEVNSIATQIKDLNQQILSITIAGKQPNDLLDKRDLLIDQLSEIADIKVYEDNNTGMITVQLGGRNLVQDVDCNSLDVQTDMDGMYMVVWEDTGIKTLINGGELRGLLDARGKTRLNQDAYSNYKEVIPDMIDKLNTLAKTIMLKTNAIHRGGYSLNNKTGKPDGTNFFNEPEDILNFDGNWAEIMQVNDELVIDLKCIAAAKHRTMDDNGKIINFGDGGNALEISQLKHDLNRRTYILPTEEINIDFTSTDPLTFDIDTGTGQVTITVAAPNTFDDMQELAEAVQEQLDDKEIPLNVRAEKGELVFYTTSTDLIEVVDPDSGISNLRADNLLNGEYKIDISSDITLGAHDAVLTPLQSYNQKNAVSILGSGLIDNIHNAATLAVNASIELTVQSVNTSTGEVTYAYTSHEYNRDTAAYTEQTGNFTLTYGGPASQTIAIGSVQLDITGLDAVSAADADELSAADKGVFDLKAATTAAADYDQVSVTYNYNSPEELVHNFVFASNQLDDGMPDETAIFRVFSLDTDQDSLFYGQSYAGEIELTFDNNSLAESSSYISYHGNSGQDPDVVENVTNDDYWRSIVSDIGVKTQEANRMVINQTVLLAQLENKRQSVSGVSLDEEMTNMIKFQHAYNASSRYITTIDETLDMIINRMGIVGRG